jgi:hypothetical protein
MLKYYDGSVSRALATVFDKKPVPHLDLARKGKSQWLIYTYIRHLFVNGETVLDSDIKYDYKHPDMVFSDTKSKMQLDVFILPLNIAFEYQGLLQ